MRRVLIVASHFAPSNLATAHRSRLFSKHLADFGWEPVIVTVDHQFYSEELDWQLAKLIPDDLRVERVSAVRSTPFGLVGDVAIRGFSQMLRRIIGIIDREGADFVFITLPSFFAALLGRLVYELRGVPYGLDYSDPWVHVWPASRRPFSKAWFSRKLGELLEPVSVRRASLITGVTEATYRDVLLRNPQLAARAVTETMPYGGEADDHRLAAGLASTPRLLGKPDKFRVVYAGTMWDGGRQVLEEVFRAVSANRERFSDVRFTFIGTGVSPTNPVPQVRPLAEAYGLGEDIVVEHPARISYIDVLAHLRAADAILVIGSMKSHYTPSKIYQSVLSGRPIVAVLHNDSPACDLLRSSGAARVLSFANEEELASIKHRFADAFLEFKRFAAAFDSSQVSPSFLEAWSARSMTRLLALALDRAIDRGRGTLAQHQQESREVNRQAEGATRA